MNTGVNAVVLAVEPVASGQVATSLFAVGVVEIVTETIGSSKLKRIIESDF